VIDDSEEKVIIELSKSEALVLFEFLSRTSDDDSLTAPDQAERRALWNLECRFEKALVEPFLPNYQELLEQAKKRLKGEYIGFEEDQIENY
jgi:hypothetical protein